MYNQYLLTELIKAQVKAEQAKRSQQGEEPKTEPEPTQDSFPSLPGPRILEEPIASSTRSVRTPLFIKGGIVMGILAGTTLGMTYLFNQVYNGEVIHIPAHGVVEFRKVDGAYAHTILIKSNPHYGKDSITVQRNTWNKTRTYIGYKGCSSVDEIILREGFLGTGAPLEYTRNKDRDLKQHMFAQADQEMQEQCHRFKPLMKPYFP
ncbi:MAG: hypothetical protein Q8R47_02030 [Nanoarchaeota archaeon]|nr:hypothetical protein [Nanoarchaeota archaeon]